jgi:hypothetical protein
MLLLGVLKWVLSLPFSPAENLARGLDISPFSLSKEFIKRGHKHNKEE